MGKYCNSDYTSITCSAVSKSNIIMEHPYHTHKHKGTCNQGHIELLTGASAHNIMLHVYRHRASILIYTCLCSYGDTTSLFLEYCIKIYVQWTIPWKGSTLNHTYSISHIYTGILECMKLHII